MTLLERLPLDHRYEGVGEMGRSAAPVFRASVFAVVAAAFAAGGAALACAVPAAAAAVAAGVLAQALKRTFQIAGEDARCAASASGFSSVESASVADSMGGSTSGRNRGFLIADSSGYPTWQHSQLAPEDQLETSRALWNQKLEPSAIVQ
eukprot:CAMPEP_0206602702 /NCGR_PEP_ID=MMETSP0325_2-20121206/47644_1 /ASSEMBLY_ACC=CAM_ASM_000347 /TAXON_ID=2866 /ORGANISM="Crypthecodinium cohnii, Strain Seligo" /LENGTH=149 /DNA_ID=CAMNT_0054115439 /DNA_START=184 /DNA_END=635 /DNA_ORIENTATION=-